MTCHKMDDSGRHETCVSVCIYIYKEDKEVMLTEFWKGIL